MHSKQLISITLITSASQGDGPLKFTQRISQTLLAWGTGNSPGAPETRPDKYPYRWCCARRAVTEIGVVKGRRKKSVRLAASDQT
jgi:hypothetical protein